MKLSRKKWGRWWRDRFGAVRRWCREHIGLRALPALERWDRRLALTVGFFSVVVILATTIGSALMVLRLYRSEKAQAVSNPLTTIFDSRLMVAGARLAILFIGMYVVLSILRHMRRGQWLTGAGPIKVSESVGHLRDKVSERDEELRHALRENERLRASASDLTREVRLLESLLDRAQTEIRSQANPPSG